MTTLDDLLTFVTARLDEDEAAAKAWLPFGNPDAAQREHIARHDPARVLREVAGKRRILDACYVPTVPVDPIREAGFRAAMSFVLTRMADTYSDHPDYPVGR